MQRSNTRSFSFLWCYSIALLLLSGATACLQGTQYKLTSGVTENGEVSSSDNNARAFACVMINSDVNETSKASAFSVVVDRFSRIHLQGCKYIIFFSFFIMHYITILIACSSIQRSSCWCWFVFSTRTCCHERCATGVRGREATLRRR